MPVFTIGYEGLTIDDFISLLTEHGVKTVVDIRELPLSRKPGFSKKALATRLNLSGFGYIHLVGLGCPKSVRNRYRKDRDWKQYSSDFLKHLKAQKSSIAELVGLVEASPCALLCLEADFNFCHRSMVAEAVTKSCGAKIKHIEVRAGAARQ